MQLREVMIELVAMKWMQGRCRFDAMIERMKEQESTGHQRSDRGRAPVTDDGSPEGKTINDHHNKDLPKMPKSQDESGNVCCFALPGLIGNMNATSKEAGGWRRICITVDSGAADSVASPESFTGYRMVEHMISKFINRRRADRSST